MLQQNFPSRPIQSNEPGSQHTDMEEQRPSSTMQQELRQEQRFSVLAQAGPRGAGDIPHDAVFQHSATDFIIQPPDSSFSLDPFDNWPISLGQTDSWIG